MPKRLIVIIYTTLIMILITACGQTTANVKSSPVEPYYTKSGLSTNSFSLPAQGVNFNSLAVMPSGKEIIASSPSQGLYVVDIKGSLIFQRNDLYSMLGFKINRDYSLFISASEQYAAVISSDTGTTLWNETFSDPVEGFDLSANGSYWAVVTDPEDGSYDISLYKNNGDKVETYNTAFKYIEVNEDGMLFAGNNGSSPSAAGFSDGAKIWELPGKLLAAGNKFAAIDQGEKVILVDSEGHIKSSLPISGVTKIEIAPDETFLVAYLANSSGENLYAYNLHGSELWSSNVPQGGEIALSGNGSLIVVASWMGYSEDITQVIVTDSSGKEINSLEISSRVQRIALDEKGSVLAMAADDGSILTFDPREEINNDFLVADFFKEELKYTPVLFKRQDERFPLALFFMDQQGEIMVPINRFVGDVREPLKAALDNLVQGPEKGSGLTRTITKDSDLEILGLTDGLLSISLDAEISHCTAEQFENMITAILFTVSQFKSVEEAEFIISDENIPSFESELLAQILDNKPLPVHRILEYDQGDLVFCPLLSGERFYLVPELADGVSVSSPGEQAEDLINYLFVNAKGLLPIDLEVEDVSISDGQAVLSLNNSFAGQTLIPEELIIDAINLTLGYNLPVEKIRIQVGKELICEQKINFPVYINPE